MVRPTAGASPPPPVPPPVQSAVAARLALLPAPPVQPISGSGSMAAAAPPAPPLPRSVLWRRPVLAAALLLVAAFFAGRWSTWHPPADELADLPWLDAAVGQVPKDIGEETQVVEVATASAAASPQSSPESAEPISAVPVATAPFVIDSQDADSQDINAEADDARVVVTSPDKQSDIALAKDPEIVATEISSALNDEPNEPLLDLVETVNPQAVCEDGKCSEKRNFGTTLTWAETPDAAAELAHQQGKLVFLIQVSGNFAREEFT